jgi:hypothetical protein
MKKYLKPLVLAGIAAAAVLASPQAEAARVAIGVGVGVPFGGFYGPPAPYWGPPYYEPRYVYAPPPVIVQAPAAVQQSPSMPDPVFYPAKGQSAGQTEADRQECNRWAATQSSALQAADVFQRATYACMEGRGYNVK